jgi:hypothetical protein
MIRALAVASVLILPSCATLMTPAFLAGSSGVAAGYTAGSQQHPQTRPLSKPE